MARRSSGEGSIGRRKDGSYYGAIRLGDERKWAYGKTRKEVADKLKEFERKYAEGMSLDVGNLTVESFIRQWLADVVAFRNKPRTHVSYEQIATIYIIPHIGTVKLSALRPDRVQQLLNDLSKQGLSARSVTYARAVLRRALNQAVQWRYISYNAAALATPPRPEQHKVEPLTREEARKLLDALKGHRLEALYLMTLFLGLRMGEVLGLLITNVDLERKTVYVEGALQRIRGKLVRDGVKTAASTRLLSLPPMLVSLLAEHLAAQQAIPGNVYLFTSTAGTPISPDNLRRQFKNVLRKAGLRDMRFHDLRHSCATFLIASGVHPRTIMQILGHSQIGVTMNIYGHVLQEAQTDAVNGISQLLAGD